LVNVKKRIKTLKALGDETRLQILLYLLKGEQPVLSIVNELKKAQPTISIGLRKLEEAELVSKKRDGKQIIYATDAKKIQKILEVLDA